MWEAIRANRRRSRLLLALMLTLLLSLGSLVGMVVAGEGEGAIVGGGAAVALWILLVVIALAGGEKIVLAGAGARKVAKEDAPQLWNVVEEMTIASGLGKMPDVYVIDDDRPNAFAVGSRPELASVAVTSGLVRRLDRDELQGVVAHEIGHVKNLDVRFMTIALMMLGSITLISDVFFRAMWLGGGRRGGRSKGGGGQGQAILLVVTILVAILAPLAARAFYFACSRRREYLADASAARFTRYPLGLASALEKIAGSAAGSSGKGVLRALAPMYTVNPMQASATRTGLFSTHPPIRKRIDILRSMGGAAGLDAYEKAFRRVVGDKANCIDATSLADEKGVAARAPSPAEKRQDGVQRAREVTDLLDRLVDVLLIACVCGVRIKVPQDLAQKTVKCPRCNRDHPVPTAVAATDQAAAAAVAAAALGAGAAAGGVRSGSAGTAGSLLFARQGGRWESFKCACGRVLQISPSLRTSSVTCKGCKRRIGITTSKEPPGQPPA